MVNNILEFSSKDSGKEVEMILENDYTYESGRILGSMCTDSHPVALASFRKYHQKNLGDPALFPGAKIIEQKAIAIIAKLLNGDSKRVVGSFVAGGSEANITALWAARNYARQEKMQKQPIILAPVTIHPSVDKAADLLSLELIKIPVNSVYRMRTDILRKELAKNPVAVVAVAGTTALGAIDPIQEIGSMCQASKTWLHIDAAFGGFTIPFLPPNAQEPFDFQVSAVNSITCDPHKMARVPIPAGVVLFRSHEMRSGIEHILPYLSTASQQQYTLSGTRTAGTAIAFYQLWQAIGSKGFEENVRTCLENTHFLAKQLQKRGFHLPVKPKMNILGAYPPSHIDLKALIAKLERKKWMVPAPNGHLRFVLMSHIRRSTLEAFLRDLDLILSENQAYE